MQKIIKNTKFQKKHLIQVTKKNFNSIELVYSNIGLKATGSGYLKLKELETIKFDLKKKLKKNITINYRTYANMPYTKKPSGVRMGKGKGEISNWFAPIKTGQIICELKSSVSDKILVEILSNIQKKLSIPTKIIHIQA